MKTNLLFLLILLPLVCMAQQQADTLRNPVFAFTPLSKNINTVNGVAFGIGTVWKEAKQLQVINGLNFEVNPLGIAGFMIDAQRLTGDKINLIHNGIHISSGGYSGGVKFNGLYISVFNATEVSNGFGIAAFNSGAQKLNGLFISGLYTYATAGNGIMLSGICNETDTYNGLQISAFNDAKNCKGLQIGIVNEAKKLKGIQIGLININSKRTLPFINWDFSKK